MFNNWIFLSDFSKLGLKLQRAFHHLSTLEVFYNLQWLGEKVGGSKPNQRHNADVSVTTSVYWNAVAVFTEKHC